MSLRTPLAEEAQGPHVRLAEVEVDRAQLESFKSAVKEGIETAVRVEPGVLALYAVSEKDNPSHVIVFEIYTDANAYATHLEMADFKNSGPLQTRWSSPANLPTPSPLC